MGNIHFVLIALAGLLGALVWADHRRLTRAMAPRPDPARLERYPSVTLIHPIKDLDPDLDQNVRSALETGYPGEVEHFFVFDDEREPGVPVVEKAVFEHRDSGRPGTAEVFFCGQPPEGRTGKLNAMLLGIRRASGDVIAFRDSDLRTDRDVLRVMVETLLQTDRAGSVFAPIVVSEPATSLGDAYCAMLLNGLYTPAACGELIKRGGDLPFILGQYMAFTRKSLRAINNLENMRGQLVDDLYIGKLIEEAGLRNVASTHPVRVIQYGLGPRRALHNFTRWMTFSRTGIPQWSFKLPIILRAVGAWVGVLAAIACASTGHGATALAFAILAVGSIASVNALHNRTGCAPLRARHWISPAVIFGLAPYVFARVYLIQSRLPWRGRTYPLNRGSRLASER
jgi:ceramide glucosyltransferase